MSGRALPHPQRRRATPARLVAVPLVHPGLHERHPLLVVAAVLAMSTLLHAGGVLGSWSIPPRTVTLRRALAAPTTFDVFTRTETPPPVRPAAETRRRAPQRIAERQAPQVEHVAPPAPEPVMEPVAQAVPSTVLTADGPALAAPLSSLPIVGLPAGASGSPGTGLSGRAGTRGEARFGDGDIVPARAVTQLPRIRSQPDEDELAREYPDEARRNDIEGEVKTRIVVDETGRVAHVVILSSPGYGLDAAAKRLLARYHFFPAKQDGRSVAVEIEFAMRFELPY